MFLKIENMKNVASVVLVGTYSDNGEVADLIININKAAVSNFKANLALVHNISKEGSGSSALCMVLLTDKKGEVTSYPMLNANLSRPIELAANL
jgi:hypothetical protein